MTAETYGSVFSEAVRELRGQPVLQFGVAAGLLLVVLGVAGVGDQTLLLALLGGLLVLVLLVWTVFHARRRTHRHGPDVRLGRRQRADIDSGTGDVRVQNTNVRGPFGRVFLRGRSDVVVRGGAGNVDAQNTDIGGGATFPDDDGGRSR